MKPFLRLPFAPLLTGCALFLLCGISAFAASPTFQAFNTNDFNTNGNLIALQASVRGITNGQANVRLLTPNLTNANAYMTAPDYNRGAINIFGVNNQTDGAQVNVFGIGATNAALFSFRAPGTQPSNTLAGDIGVWNENFGAGYTRAFTIDLYNTNSAFIGPNFRINLTGVYSGDSGLVTHPIFYIANTNTVQELDLNYFVNDSRSGRPGFKFDSRMGVVAHPVSSTNLLGTGTVASSGTRSLVGTGTLFGDNDRGGNEMGYGDTFVQDVTSYTVTATASTTAATLFEPLSTSFAGSNYHIYKSLKFKDINGSVQGAVTPQGGFFSKNASGKFHYAITGGTVEWSQFIGGGGVWIMYNSTDNGTPLILDRNGNVTFSGNVTTGGTVVGAHNTNSGPFTIVSTDFVMNQYYTNVNQRAYVSACVGLASTSGLAAVGLWLDQAADGTFEQTGIRTAMLPNLDSPFATNQIGAFIQPGGRFIFTNLSAAAAASASIVAGSSQWTKQ